MMKRKNPIVFLLILACVPFGLFLVFYLFLGFSPRDEEDLQTTLEGVVAEVTEENVLLVEGLSVDEVLELDDEALLEEATGAHRVTITESIDDIEIGMEIIVWVTTIAESYPTQSTAEDFEVQED